MLAQKQDSSQPYLAPAPGTSDQSGPPPSAVFSGDDEVAAPLSDRRGTDHREETPVDSVSRRQPAQRAATAPDVPAPRAVPATQFQPPPRPLPVRQPSGRSATVLPDFAVRVDPLEILLAGRFAPQLAVELLDFMTLEFVPLFLVSSEPAMFGNPLNFHVRDGAISQFSAGIGPLAGAAIGVGFWLAGEPFRGYVVRAQITNYGIEYRSNFDDYTLDYAVFVERRVSVLVGKAYRWGPLVLEGALGMSYELNPSNRCDLRDSAGGYQARSYECGGSFEVATEPTTGGAPANIFSGMHPLALTARIALGFAID